MSGWQRLRRALPSATAAALATLLLAGCGGGSGSSSSTAVSTSIENYQPVTVNAGPTGQVPNLMLTQVTVCVPGTSNCQTIDNVQVDTGSSGLRLLASAVTIGLPAITSGSSTYYECAGFADGEVWGPLARADVQLGGEKASSLPIQIIQDTGSAQIPSSCSGQGAIEDSQSALGANGILGIGVFLQDCGTYCVSNLDTVYYLCASTSNCPEATITVANQVSNPVAFFAQDNDGVLVQLPHIADGGAAEAAGLLIFGIGTQANNALTAVPITVPATGATAGSFTVAYKGNTFTDGFFDSGSTVDFFTDSSIPTCSASTTAGDLSSYFCPGSPTALSLTTLTLTATGSNGVANTITTSIGNAQYLFTQSGAAALNAFDDVGAVEDAFDSGFDLGLPFFFGKTVYVAFEQRATPAGTGPYYAYQAD